MNETLAASQTVVFTIGATGEPCRFVAPAHEWPHGKRSDGSGGMPHCCAKTERGHTDHKCFCGWTCPDGGKCWMDQRAFAKMLRR